MGYDGGGGRRPGNFAGRLRMREGFDDPLPEDLQAAFEGRPERAADDHAVAEKCRAKVCELERRPEAA